MRSSASNVATSCALSGREVSSPMSIHGPRRAPKGEDGAFVTGGNVCSNVIVTAGPSLSRLVQVSSFPDVFAETISVSACVLQSLHSKLELLERRRYRESQIVFSLAADSSERLSIERRDVMLEQKEKLKERCRGCEIARGKRERCASVN